VPRRLLIGCLAAAISAQAGASCSSPAPAPTHSLQPAELELRKRLGIPAGAQRAVLLGQTSHLDIDWQLTFDAYYKQYVETAFLEARKLLDADPRAFYAIAEMGFLAHHLEVHPEERAPLAADVARGALRIVGGGVTSPDTLLPETELLARDWLFGIRFAEDTLGAHPHAAWLPDSFGHSGTAPDMLTAAGFDSVAFARVDGAPTLFDTLFHADTPMKPGSTGEALQKAGSADFVWQGAGGASILAHYLAGPRLYCQGDNIDYQEKLEVPGGHTGPLNDTPEYTDSQIDSYVAELTPWSKTPYLFVPVGCDFQAPKAQLIGYADGYNRRRYPMTHVFVVAAPFDDYETLVGYWRDVLPTVSHELSPYYMGFYGSRADIKRNVRDSARPFFVAETFATVLGAAGKAMTLAARPELEKLTRADHHDFITGTSANDVTTNEQLPLLAETFVAGETELDAVASAIAKRIPMTANGKYRVLVLNASSATLDDVAQISLPLNNGAAPLIHAVSDNQEVAMTLAFSPAPGDKTATFDVAIQKMPSFAWKALDFLSGAPAAVSPRVTLTADAQKVVLSNEHLRAEWDATAGVFALSSVVIDGVEMLAAPSMVIHDYKDTGGLWRVGSEMSGCEFSPLPSVAGPDTVRVIQNGPLRVSVAFDSNGVTREATLAAGATGLELAIRTNAALKTTRTVGFAFTGTTPVRTSSPAGFVERPMQRVYEPTFHPAVLWAETGGNAILLRQSTGVSMSKQGVVELMAVRWAPAEQCDSEGGTGDDSGSHRIEWRLERVVDVSRAELYAQAFNRPLELRAVPLDQATLLDLAPLTSLLGVSGGGVVSALKPADRGDGLVVRVLPMVSAVHLTPSPLLNVTRANWVDLAERDGAPLPFGATIDVDRKTSGSIASIRLR